MTRSEQLFEEAARYAPRGASSIWHAFEKAGQTPRLFYRAEGSRVYDVDGHVYVDFGGSGGYALLGHNPPPVKKAVLESVQSGLYYKTPVEAAVKLAKLISQLVSSAEMVSVTASVEQAFQGAIAAARAVTGRGKIIVVGSACHLSGGAAVLPDSHEFLTAPFNDIGAVEQLFSDQKDGIAALITEPVSVHASITEPGKEFLTLLGQLCRKNGTVLIFDETVTGFRLALGGAQQYYGGKPDLTVFGETLGSGLPIGAIAGNRSILEREENPETRLQEANPLAAVAGLAQLTAVLSQPLLYENLAREGERLRTGLKGLFPHDTVTGVGSLCHLRFTGSSSKHEDGEAMFWRYFSHMMNNGFFLPPSPCEPIVISGAHTDHDIGLFLDATAEFLA